MNQSEMFEREGIVPSYSLTSPLIWIERISLWEALGAEKPIREITFRQGLNIIATEIAQETDTKPVGHDVGKTLLMRIIRYCLGDDHYADEETRNAVGSEFPNGYVLAHIIVDDQSWYVARPLGLGSHRMDSWCFRTSNIERIKNPEETEPYTSFVTELNRVTQRCYADIGLPCADNRPAHWQDLLGWLSRDQECLNRHRAEWRVAEAQSGPRVLKATDAYLVMRMALDILGEEEIQKLGDHDKLQRRFRSDENEYEKLRSSLAGARFSLIETCENQKGALVDPAEDELFGEAVINHAAGQIKSLQRLQSDLAKEFDLTPLERRKGSLTKNQAKLEVEIEQLIADKELIEKTISELEQQENDAFVASFSKPDFACEFYSNQEIAKERGCPGFDKNVLENHPNDPDIRRQLEIQKFRDQLEFIDRQLVILKNEKQPIDADLEIVTKEMAEKSSQFVLQNDGITKCIAHWELIKQQGENYREHSKRMTHLAFSLKDRDRKTDESLKKITEARKESSQKITLLSTCYNAVIQQIVSADTEAAIRVDMTGVHPDIGKKSSSGATLKTCAQVLAFDFGCLAASLCGLGFMPRLWMHDSPRSADTEDQLYHSVMMVSHWLESFYEGRSIPFQQIWTTTSAPPKKLDNDTYVRDRLSARTQDGKLLKRNF